MRYGYGIGPMSSIGASLLLVAFGTGCGGETTASPHPEVRVPEFPQAAVSHTQDLGIYMMQAALKNPEDPMSETLFEMQSHLSTPLTVQSQLQMTNAYLDAATSRPPVETKALGSPLFLRGSNSSSTHVYQATMGSLDITVKVIIHGEDHCEWEMRVDGQLDELVLDDYLFAEGMTRVDEHPTRGEGWYAETTTHTWDGEEDVVHMRNWTFDEGALTIGEAESTYLPFMEYEMTEQQATFWLYEDEAGTALFAWYDIEVDLGGEAEFYCDRDVSDGELWLTAEWTLPAEGEMDLEVCAHPSPCSEDLGCTEFFLP